MPILDIDGKCVVNVKRLTVYCTGPVQCINCEPLGQQQVKVFRL